MNCEYKNCKLRAVLGQDFCNKHLASDSSFNAVESSSRAVVGHSTSLTEEIIAGVGIAACLASGPVGWLFLLIGG